MIGSKQTDSCQDIYEFVVKVLSISFVRHNVTVDKKDVLKRHRAVGSINFCEVL